MALPLDDIVAISSRDSTSPLPSLGSETACQLVVQFNESAGVLARTIGTESAGRVAWAIYGPGGLLHDAMRRAPERQRLTAIRSLLSLYLEGFASYCSHRIGEEWPTSLDLACYMLWDMNGGLRDACFDSAYASESQALVVLESCLHHSSEALQESALHALNHLYWDRPDVAVPMINRYLSTPGRSHAARSYALQCRNGIAQ